MIYLGIVVLLFLAILSYFKIADRFNIIDKPNQRSSHTLITIRGGGIIFPIAALLWFAFFGFRYPYFTLGLFFIAIISFADDRLTLSTKPRLAVHLLSVGLMLYGLGFINFEWYYWALGFVLVIGWLNAFNFMDGINGITAFYALAVLVPLVYINKELTFVEMPLMYVVGISLLIFAWFNARKKARTFAGDIGSVSMGFILAFLLISLLIETQRWVYILFVAVYGIDAVLTIVQRLLRGDNIFQAHRTHLYQYLANEVGWSHISVSVIYTLVQLFISALVLVMVSGEVEEIYFGVLLVVLGLFYLMVKLPIQRKLVAIIPKKKE